ncbi:MAG: TolB family protein [Chloroflexota bacterium]
MTTMDRFEQDVRDWLNDDARRRLPTHLHGVLAQTAATRQRPAWSSLGRWLPVDTTLHPRLFNAPRLGQAVLVGAIVIAMLGLLAVAIGSRPHPLPPPFGLARNGIVVAGIDGDLFRIDPVSGVRTALVSDSPDEFDFSPTFSRDGTKLVYLRSVVGKGLELVVANPDGTNAKVVGPAVDGLDQYDWSPDGSRIVFLSRELGRGRINVANSDGTGVATTLKVPFPVNQVSWLPPDGNAILFRREHMLDTDPVPGIFAIAADGTGGPIPVSTRRAVGIDDYQDVSASADGTHVGYRESEMVGEFRVHILDRRTGEDRVLPASPDSLGQTSPSFSPDGIHVMYLRITAGIEFHLVIAPLDGASTGTVLPLTGRLTDEGPSLNNFFFTPDGRAVVGNDQTTQTEWLLPIDGSPGTVLARGSQATDGLSTVQRLAP